jgi:hypothetical protein
METKGGVRGPILSIIPELAGISVETPKSLAQPRFERQLARWQIMQMARKLTEPGGISADATLGTGWTPLPQAVGVPCKDYGCCLVTNTAGAFLLLFDPVRP